MKTEGRDLEAFNSGSELEFSEFRKNPYLDVTQLVHFPGRAASILFLSIYGHKIPSFAPTESCQLHD